MSNHHARDWRGDRTFGLEVAKGTVTGHAPVHKWGKNPGVGVAGFEHIWFDGGSYNWLQAADYVRIAAGGNAADDAGGSGARTVVVEGLEAGTWDEVSATLTTAGIAASAQSSVQFIRVNRAYVETCGTYDASNTGDIHVETVGGVVMAHIDTELGQSQLAHYSVARDRQLLINSLRLGVFSSKSATVRFVIRLNANDVVAPVSPHRVISEWNGLDSQIQFTADPPYSFPSYTDVWLEAKADGGQSTAVYAEFDGILVDYP